MPAGAALPQASRSRSMITRPHRLAAALALLGVLPACAPSPDRGGGPAADRHVVDWEPYPIDGSAPPPLDRGVGVVYFARLPGTARQPTTDSLAVLADSSAGADTVALFLLREASASAYRYGVASADSLTPNVVEFDYEIAGMPIDTFTASGWARVVVGFTRDGQPRTGWAAVRPDDARVMLWRERLPEQSLYFADGVPPEFHEVPGGAARAVTFDDTLGYSMQPLEVRDDWMRVRVSVPHECRTPVDEPARTMDAWIRFLDERGRPRVWYAPRGC